MNRREKPLSSRPATTLPYSSCYMRNASVYYSFEDINMRCGIQLRQQTLDHLQQCIDTTKSNRGPRNKCMSSAGALGA